MSDLASEVEEFLYAAVHDLRGPLGQVRALTVLLDRHHKDSLNADGRELCSLIDSASKRAVNVVDSIRSYAQVLESPVFEPADTNAIIDAACYTLQHSIDTTQATITRDPLPLVHGDRAKLMLLFQELLRNALLFRGDGPPRIHCSATKQEFQIAFSVLDNGPGVPQRYVEQIFKPFKRIDGHAHEGTGMGLAICRRIVEMHGGKIWVECPPRGGADFRFTLPASVPADPQTLP